MRSQTQSSESTDVCRPRRLDHLAPKDGDAQQALRTLGEAENKVGRHYVLCYYRVYSACSSTERVGPEQGKEDYGGTTKAGATSVILDRATLKAEGKRITRLKSLLFL